MNYCCQTTHTHTHTHIYIYIYIYACVENGCEEIVCRQRLFKELELIYLQTVKCFHVLLFNINNYI